MFKLSAWEEGYAYALMKLGWDPAKVRQLIAQNRAGVEKARALYAAKAPQRAQQLAAGSPLIQQMAAEFKMSPVEMAQANLGMRAPGMAPPVPVSEKIHKAMTGPSPETRTALMAAGF